MSFIEHCQAGREIVAVTDINGRVTKMAADSNMLSMEGVELISEGGSLFATVMRAAHDPGAQAGGELRNRVARCSRCVGQPNRKCDFPQEFGN